MSDFENENKQNMPENEQHTRVMQPVDGEKMEAVPPTRHRRIQKLGGDSASSGIGQNEDHHAKRPVLTSAPEEHTTRTRPVHIPTAAEIQGNADRVPRADATANTRTVTREATRREVPSQGVPRPAALNRADQGRQTPAGDKARNQQPYRQPVSAPGYTPSKPVGTAQRRPAIPQTEYEQVKPEGKGSKVLFIVVAVVLVLALAILGMLVIPDDAGGVLGTVKHAVTSLVGGGTDERAKATEVPPAAVEFYGALTQVNAGETVTFNLTTNKNTTDVRLVDMDGNVLITQNTQVDNTEDLIWIIKMVPAEAYDGLIYAQVTSGEGWIDTGKSIELEVLAPVVAVVETSTPEVTITPTEEPTATPAMTEAPTGTPVPTATPVVTDAPTATPAATQAPIATEEAAEASQPVMAAALPEATEPLATEIPLTEAPATEVPATPAPTQAPVVTPAATQVPVFTTEPVVTEEPEATEAPVIEVTPTLAPSATPTAPIIAVTPVPETVAAVNETAAPAAAQMPADVNDVQSSAAFGQLEVVADESADPSLITAAAIFDGSKNLTSYLRDQADMINMPAADNYTRLPYGVLTFRGNAFRQNAAEGTVGELSEIDQLWRVEASTAKGSSNVYYGINYTGQPAIIKWSTEVRGISNLYDEAKNTKGLTEVIIAGDDGRIYFLNLKTGEATRDVIKLGYPMRGTPSIHPYGFPMMSVGQYARKMSGRTGDIGLRLYSLVDQKQMHLIDGLDKSFERPYYKVGSFETSALIDPESDTMVTAGTNGLLYLTKLNTRFEYNATTGEGSMNISPSTVVLRAKAARTEEKQNAIESSVAMYQNYVFYADMKGILRCVDTNTLETKWAVATGDAVEAAISLDLDDDGTLWLYTANTLQNRSKGSCQVRRYNAATGAEDWTMDLPVNKQQNIISGFRASGVIGQNGLDDYVYYAASSVSKTAGQELGFGGAAKGALLCLDKNSGEVVWAKSLDAYTYSSPVAVYTESGKGYVIQAVSDGSLFLLDGLTGELISFMKVDGIINASPAVYKNILVIGTTGSKGRSAIYGIELK